MNPLSFGLVFIAALASILGCRHQAGLSNSSVEFDSKLLLPWSMAHQNVGTAKSPALYEFKRHGKTLWYLASKHSNSVDAPGFKLIEWAMENRSPDIIILEGFGSSLGLNPKDIAYAALEGAKSGFYPSGEVGFAIEKALERKIPFIGGEPSDRAIFNSAIRRGYSANDLLSFEFVRRMPQINRSGELKGKKIETIYSDYIRSRAKTYQIEDTVLSFDEFKKWYSAKQGKEFSLSSGEKGETAPIDSGPYLGPYFTQKISIDLTRDRDEHIISTIGEMLTRYNNVLIIYGSSHYRIQHEALKQTMGAPTELAVP